MPQVPRAVSKYYEAWCDRAGDMSEVPLAEKFVFEGPTGRFDTPEAFQEMVSQFGPVAQNFRVREQFIGADGRVCSIVQWELPGVQGTTTAAEILTVDGDHIASAELLYDPALVTAFIAQSAPTNN